ncbi:2TM domain-containing protein [Flavobacterium sp.]
MELIMEPSNNDYEKYQKAHKQVQEIKGFYGHLLSFVIVILFLLFINLKYSPQYLWFFWPLLGWGIGLLFHGMRVFNYMPFFGKNWEEQKIKEFMDKENKTKNKYQ